MSQTVELPEDLILVRELGSGSCARVYLAREPTLGRLVAVKVLHPSLAADEVTRLRFEREARATAVIRHPNVVAVHRVGRLSDGVPFLVMEHVDGRSLTDLLQARGSLPVDEARRIIASVARGLEAAHRKGIVHRDVRPDNVIVETDTERVVLLDFGIAAILDTESSAATRLTRPGQVVGRIRYMGPEQLGGEGAGEQSDVYALGVLAHDLLTGAPAAKDSMVPFGEPTPLSTLNSQVDERLSELVARCVRADPRHRPRAGELADELLRSPEAHERGSTATASDGDGFLDSVGLRQFQRELKRRKVYRVAAAYAAIAFVLLQALQLLLPGLPLAEPEGWYGAAVTLTLAGFPLALALSWIFDLTRSGITRSEASLELGRPGHGRRLLPLAGLALAAAVAFALWRSLL